MPYRACDRCDRKVPGVEVCILQEGDVMEMCKRCRELYDGRFQGDAIAEQINAGRRRFIRERIAFNRRMRNIEAQFTTTH
jgi:ribosome-binding protein aMBF1 (putative translation factor)